MQAIISRGMECSFPLVSRMIRDFTVLSTAQCTFKSGLIVCCIRAGASLACHGKTRWTLTKKPGQSFQFSHYVSLAHLKELDPFFFRIDLLFLLYFTTERSDILSLYSIHFHQTTVRKKIHEWETEALVLCRSESFMETLWETWAQTF